MIDTIYVLAKNERRNIGRCLDEISGRGIPVVVLDSGSTDGTQQLVSTYLDVELRLYDYSNHADAYNAATNWHTCDEAVAILDADMVPEQGWIEEVVAILAVDSAAQAIESPIMMYWAGRPLRYGSLYPPKSLVFRGGRSYFIHVGHGERLIDGIRVARTDSHMRHDDRRDYSDELQKQWRYALTTYARVKAGQGTNRDRLRTISPIAILAAPIVSYVVRGGFLTGKTGVLYALDRLIAEALTYRAAVTARLNSKMPK